MREIDISSQDGGQRLDKFLIKYLNKAPKSFIYKMLRKKNIKLNDRKASGDEIIANGDVIKLFLADETIESFREKRIIKKAKIDFKIVYEDENIIICDKPQGLIAHPDKKHKSNTLNDQLIYYLTKKGEYDPENSLGFVPSICNRLDLNTSGMVTMGKNLAATQELNRGFKDRLIEKYYLTVVKGVVANAGIVEGYHIKDDKNLVSLSDIDNGGSYVCTHYRPLTNNGKYTLLEVKLETGKSHQIRVCMKYIGHPIIGDRKYGDREENRFFVKNYGLDNQFLHSYRLVMKMYDGYLDYLYDQEFICELSGKLKRVKEILF